MNYYQTRAICLFVLLVLYAIPASIHAQQSPDSTSVEEVAPVTLTEFVANINDATFRLENIRESLVDSAAVEQFLRNEHQFSNDVAELRLQLARLSQTRPSLLQLDDMSRHWDRLASTQGSWVDGLNNLAQSHGSESQWIDSVRDEWDHIVSVTEPDELTIYSDRVSVFFENVDEIDALLRAQLVQAVQIADNLALDGFVIEHSKRTIDKLKNDLRQRYMERDGSLLFLPTNADAVDGEISGRVSERMIDARLAIVSFFEKSTTQIIYHISLLIGLLLLTQLVYRRRMRQRPQGDEQEDEDFRGAAHIISRPYSTAFLLAASATPIIYPYAPNSVYDLSSLLAIVPLVRLIPGMIPKGMIRPFYAFMGIYLVHELRGFLPIYSLPGRIALLIVTALLLTGLVRILRSESYREGIDSDRVASIIKWALVVVLAFVGISVVGSVIGYLSLSDFLSEAVFSLIYTGLLLYTALQLLEGGWTVFIRSSFARRLRAIDRNASLFIGRGHKLLGLGAGFWWLYMLAYQFGFDVFVAELIDDFLTFSIEVGALSINIGSMVSFVVMMWATVLTSRFVRFMLNKDVYWRLGLGRGIPDAISTLTNYAILGGGFLLAFSAAGLNFESLALMAGAVGIGIGFGLQTIVNNFLSGLILIFERPIHVGDMIQVQSAEGSILANVKQIGIRASTVRTVDGAEVIMPNSNLVSNDVINWTKSDKNRRLDVNIGVAYGTRLQTVQDILFDVASKVEDVSKDPGPVVLFAGFGDSSLDFIVRFWTSNFDNAILVKSAVSIAVHDAIMDAGIEIPFPQRDVHLKTEPQETQAKHGPEKATEPEPHPETQPEPETEHDR